MPLTFDMPLEALTSYQGRNPRPQDFDAFWTRSLAELDRLDPQIQLIPADRKAPSGKGSEPDFAAYYDLYFTGVGGSRIYAKLIKPLGSAAQRRAGSNGKGPAIVQFHGYSMNSGDWQSRLGLAAAGFTVAAMDCRGQGGRSEDRTPVYGNTLNGHMIRGLEDALRGEPEHLLYRSMFLDTVQLVRIVMSLDWIDPDRIGVTGWSQGGGLTLACAALEPRVARAAPVYPFLCDYKRVWEMDLAKDAYGELHDYFRRFDPLHEREDQVFTTLGYIDVQHLAPRIKAEVLQAIALMDTICPPSSQFAAYNKITATKRHLLYPDFGHEDLPGLHDHILDFMCGL
ncbi:acetylxylan esterase [Gracilinema caldarium]|uniref:Cephalosporin-C deacetylase n=1 Tax=Gracilinema caldarium (strain ATCC 51460 / DSM 7334 / H1) TaxID=744872 RepID=F8EXD2_GRAC1|nr:alpha/beta fold hydrolase [Gracilinema caldarium]AEJ19159.1 Cephalosporin-C deacetylase [Gracilinema caldarium DSM 7334]